jgi:peptidoglycan/LPS O-acetylase OafA/YrhL
VGEVVARGGAPAEHQALRHPAGSTHPAALLVVVVVVLTTLPEIQPVPRDQWVIHLLGLQIYQPGGPIEGLYQTWSLCTEISFYVVLPYLGWLGTGRTHRARTPHGAGRW